MNRWALKIAVIAALIGIAFALRDRQRLPAPRKMKTAAPLDTASDVVNRLFDAAGKGDDVAYLRLLSGQLRQSLDYQRSQLGAEAFRQSLRQSTAGVKGLAITQSSDAPAGLIALDVEIVFTDRNEVQKVLLAPQGRGWAVISMDTAEIATPPIPYGTPVFAEPDQEGMKNPKGQETAE